MNDPTEFTAEHYQNILHELRHAKAEAAQQLAALEFEPDYSTLAALLKSSKSYSKKYASLQEKIEVCETLQPLVKKQLRDAQAREAAASREAAQAEVAAERTELLAQLPEVETDQLAKANLLAKLAANSRRY